MSNQVYQKSAGSVGSMPEREQHDKERISQTVNSVFHKNTVAKKRGKYTFLFQSPFLRVCTYISLFSILVLLFYASYGVSVIISVFSLYKGKTCLTKNDAVCVKKWSLRAHEWIGYSQKIFPIASVPFQWIEDASPIDAHEKLLRFLESAASFEKESIDFAHIGTLFLSSVFGTMQPLTTSESPIVTLRHLSRRASAIKTDLDVARTLLPIIREKLPIPLIQHVVASKLHELEQQLMEVNSALSYIDKFLTLYPMIGGFRNKKTYLVLLQNDTELRPTGGFIGSLCILTMEDGKIVALQIEDVYTLDGQLKGHVDPPLPIREVLGSEHWYLRDSNWNPDFRESAKKVMWFYEKERGENVDGVIGLTSSFIVQLLTMVGPLELTDFKDTITSQNFYPKALSYTQKDFFPGSTQKKDFLGSLFSALLLKLTSKTGIINVSVFKLIENSFKKRDIQLNFSDPELEVFINTYGWSGAMPSQASCDQNDSGKPCLFDFIAVNEANVGVNKANYFVRRSGERHVTIDEEGRVTETITRTIHNVSNGEPGSGPYRVYMRIFIPSSVILTSLTLDNIPVQVKDVRKKIPALPFGEFDTTLDGLTSVAVAFDVPPGQIKNISLTYVHGQTLVFSDTAFSLDIFEQKQAGVPDMPVRLTVGYPAIWKVMGNSNIANPGKLEYNTFLSQDTSIVLTFYK